VVQEADSVAKAAAVAAAARRIWSATANPDGPGLLERGREFQPRRIEDFDPLVVQALIRLARLTDSVADSLREHPDTDIRLSAAVVAARAHPIRAALDG
jgi:hypothetical protein